MERPADTRGHDVLVELGGLLIRHLDVVGVHVAGVRVRGLVSVPALKDDVHDVFVSLVRSGLAGGDANAKVRGVKAALDGL
jgi:hypothetical protein